MLGMFGSKNFRAKGVLASATEEAKGSGSLGALWCSFLRCT